MYQISRSIYRELEAEIAEGRWGDGPSNHERVLRSCEAAVHRLATDRHYFARPSRTLFNDIRAYFPMSAQLHVYRVVDRYLSFARDAMTAGEIAELFDHSWPSTSRHLRLLEAAGIIEHERRWRRRLYRINRQPLKLVTEWLAWFYWDPRAPNGNEKT